MPADTLDEIEKLVRRAAAGDTILFYYAGHGHLHGNDSYLLLPHTEPDAWEQTAIPLRDISDRLRATDRVNVRIFDACHSGIDVRDGAERLNPRGFSRAILEEAQQGWITLAACSEDESSYPDATTSNGIFTRALCDSIIEMPPGPVFPETLKVRLVDRVRRRATQLACKQTPVLNAFVRGNIAIAERRTQPAISEVKILTPAELLSRVAAIRTFPTLGGAEHKERLKQYIDKIHACLERAKDSLSLGLSVVVRKPASINNAPYEFRKPIVQEISGIGLTNHEIRETSEEIMEQPQGLLAIMQMQPAKPTGRYRTVYRVFQTQEWPESWCALELSGDGYIPSFTLAFYVVPFQFKASLLCIIASKGKHQTSEASWDVESVTRQGFTLDVSPTEEVIEGLIGRSLSTFSEICVRETTQRIARLENELLPKK